MFTEIFKPIAFAYKGWKAGLCTVESRTKFIAPDGVLVSWEDCPEDVVAAYWHQAEMRNRNEVDGHQ